ncbi:MAG: thioredoxin domain-containing protein [Deltaproteobacteria bacterium]|nr:thioredoxin domain-containing protein [Deltaproteobacteria bacterium]
MIAKSKSIAWVALLGLLGMGEVNMQACANDPSRHAGGQNAAERAKTIKAQPQRSPQQIRAEGNGLKNQTSRYLRQHAHNPVDWQPWGDEAIKQARDENKPIFLSIGYASCHWCHVMEREVFEDDGIAEVLNQYFVSIKVDREERPDLDTVYMNAVVAMTGSGGWPMSLFLTPNLKPFFGGTYFPPQQFMLLIMELARSWDRSPGKAVKKAEQISKHIREHLATHTDARTQLEKNVITRWAQTALAHSDPVYGGLKGRMKFPMPVTWRWLLAQHDIEADAALKTAIQLTLDKMAGGGLQDQLGGGFHRYTVDTDWTVPHFEKMLYDNAQLASLYLEAAAAFDHEPYRQTAARTLDFLLEQMHDPAGGFYASFDADSEGVEGTFYIWTREEIKAVAGEADAEALADVLGVSEQGNFEHKNVLTQRANLQALATKHGRSQEELAALPNRHREALLAFRALRKPPSLDKKIITSWNGLAISAMAQGSMLLDDERYLSAAKSAADFLLSKHRRQDGGLYRVSNGGHAEVPAVLDDYAFLANGLIDLFQAGGDLSYLRAAKDLLDFTKSHFAHPDGTYYLTESSVNAPLGRPLILRDGVRPSGNAALLLALDRLSAIAGDRMAHEQVGKVLHGRKALIERAGMEMGAWLQVGLRLLHPSYEVVVAGRRDNPATQALVKQIHKHLPANVVLVQLGPEGADVETLKWLPALGGKKAMDGKATAYVCTLGTCKMPTSDPSTLLKQIQ